MLHDAPRSSAQPAAQPPAASAPEPALGADSRRPRMTASAALRDWIVGGLDWVKALLPRRASAAAQPASPLGGRPSASAEGVSRASGPGESSACGRTTVLVLPGILENDRYLRPLLAHLGAQGHHVVTVPRLGLNLRTVETSLELAFAALEAAGRPETVILAHSKGGLIGRAMLSDPRSHGALHGMVAIAAPFHGSLLWPRVQETRLVQASPLGLFHPRSRHLSRTDRPHPSDARIVSLLPRGDQVVTEGSALDGARNIELPVAGHFGSVHDPACWDLVHTELDAIAARSSDGTLRTR
ncbi:esterase/lipase family protein [Brachybacterium sp. DNPG3]